MYTSRAGQAIRLSFLDSLKERINKLALVVGRGETFAMSEAPHNILWQLLPSRGTNDLKLMRPSPVNVFKFFSV